MLSTRQADYYRASQRAACRIRPPKRAMHLRGAKALLVNAHLIRARKRLNRGQALEGGPARTEMMCCAGQRSFS